MTMTANVDDLLATLAKSEGVQCIYLGDQHHLFTADYDRMVIVTDGKVSVTVTERKAKEFGLTPS